MTLRSFDARRAAAGGDRIEARLLIRAHLHGAGELVARALRFRDVLTDLGLRRGELRLRRGARRLRDHFRRRVAVALYRARLEGIRG